MSTEPGWYDDGSGRTRWWDGTAWTERYLDQEKAVSPPPPQPGTQYHPKMDEAAAGELQPKKGGNALLWGCLGCFGVPLVVVIGFMIFGAIRGPAPYDANNQYEAIAQCEERVKELLKAPATAEFDTTASGSDTWIVTGTVDAENGFGALVRSSFQCTVVISGESASTTVDFLE